MLFTRSGKPNSVEFTGHMQGEFCLEGKMLHMSHHDVQLCLLNVVMFSYHQVKLNYVFIVY